LSTVHAACPSAFVYQEPGNGDPIDHLLWGDYVRLLGPEQGEWAEVRVRGKNGWMRKEDTQEQRLLEVNFVDIGQGDGCFIVTPEDQFILVDAGQEDNMFRFLRWRFNMRGNPDRPVLIQHAVISHPDSDHYYGFDELFGDALFRFETVFHNGIVERVGDQSLGPRQEVGENDNLTDVIDDRALLETIIGDPAKVGRKWYPNLLKDAATLGRVGDIRMLCSEDGFVPGYEDGELVIRVLAPVPEDGPGGRRMLRWFNDEGKTKNGHSVVLKLEYRGVKILLGGDLNTPAEEYLLRHYTGLDPRPETPEDEQELIARARETFEADVAKACHHGSADFTDLFLRAVNATATIVSSGDNESHAHPRPDSLGALGKNGRGSRPLIFSTELARSVTQTTTPSQEIRDRITQLSVLRDKEEDEDKRTALVAEIERLQDENRQRIVTVYGMINLRTDGERVVLAQKLEKPGSGGREWDIHLFEPDAAGHLEYVSEH
jgi:beta-lactamase superfamily II metal-dependent hydrolase